MCEPIICLPVTPVTAARSTLDEKRKRLDTSRKRYALLRRQLEGEFQALDTLEAKVAELEAIRKVRGAVTLIRLPGLGM
jgi:hypothetical protein